MPNLVSINFKLAEFTVVIQTELKIEVAKSSRLLLLSKKIYIFICFCSFRLKF